MLSTTRGKILALVFLAVVAGGGIYAWKTGLLDSVLQRTQKDKDDKKGKDKDDKQGTPPKATTRQELFKELGLADAKKVEVAERELKDSAPSDDALYKDATKKGGISPLLLLNADKAQALRGLFPAKQMTLEDARKAREYLTLWRKHLVALRAAAREAGIHEIEKKLPETALTLRFLAELGSNGNVEGLAAPDEAAPGVPWFTPADQKTADLLDLLFAGDTPARKFAVTRFKVDPRDGRYDLQDVLKAMCDEKKLAAAADAFEAEMQEAINSKLVPNRARIGPADRAVTALFADLKRGLQPPK